MNFVQFHFVFIHRSILSGDGYSYYHGDRQTNYNSYADNEENLTKAVPLQKPEKTACNKYSQCQHTSMLTSTVEDIILLSNNDGKI